MLDETYEEKNKYLLRALAVKSLTRSLVDMSRKASKSTPLKRSKHRFGHPTPNQDRFSHPTLIWRRGNASAAEALRIGVGVGSVAWVSDVDLLMVDRQ